jgi:hypothetical protein
MYHQLLTDNLCAEFSRCVDPKLKARRWMENEGGVVRLLF